MIHIIHNLIWGGLILGSGLFLYYSLREREIRAALICAAAIVLISAVAVLTDNVPQYLTLTLDSFILFILILLILPLDQPHPTSYQASPTRYDERDIMFARARYERGSPAYVDYYTRRPETKNIDDTIRKLPELLEMGGTYYKANPARIADAYFETIQKMHTFCDDQPISPPVSLDKKTATDQVKSMARSLGACDVGITAVKPHHLYTHIGRRIPEYGTPVILNHDQAVVFALEMDYDIIKSAPTMPVIVESSRQYLRAAFIAVTLARFIRSHGYEARAHIDGNYLAILPALAVDAGLGEIGRLGYCIHPRFGARIRLGAVTTTMPLHHDSPVTFGVQKFCRLCVKCAEQCPAGAISFGNEKNIRGVRKWSTHQESCYRYWRQIGTDCAICMMVCPYSKPATLPHNIIRFIIKRNKISRRLAVRLDSLLYPRI